MAEEEPPLCAVCLIREARPGSAYCGWLCRLFARIGWLWREP